MFAALYTTGRPTKVEVLDMSRYKSAAPAGTRGHARTRGLKGLATGGGKVVISWPQRKFSVIALPVIRFALIRSRGDRYEQCNL